MSHSKEFSADDVIGIEGTGTTGPTGAIGPSGATGATGAEGATGSGSGPTPNVGFYDSQDTTDFSGGDTNIPWNAEIEDSKYTLEGSPFELISVDTTGLYRISYSVIVENTNGTLTNEAVCDIICGIDDAGTIQDDINGACQLRLGGGRKGVASKTFMASLTANDEIGIRCSQASGSGDGTLGGDDHVLSIEFVRTEDHTTFESGFTTDFYSSGEVPVGISETYTIGMWLRLTSAAQSAGNAVFQMEESGGINNSTQINYFNNDFNVTFYDSAGANQQDYNVEDLPSAGGGAGWHFWVFQYDYNGGTVLNPVYYDGGVLPTSVQSGAGDPWVDQIASNNPQQDSADRLVSIGTEVTGGTAFAGRIYNIGVWDVILTADEITALYNGGNGLGVDYRDDIGDYASAGDLQLYYRFDDSGNRGDNTGLQGSSADVDTESNTTFHTDDVPQ